MTVESGDRPGLVRQVGQRLAVVDQSLSEPLDQFRPWRNMLHGLIGAVYSLNRAIPVLSNRTRAFEQTASEARAMIEAIRSSRDLAVHNAKLWYAGHFLNNAEFRIASVLHQVLKAGYPCEHFERYNVPRLVARIVKHDLCAQCGAPPLTAGADSVHTVTSIHEKSPTCPLFMVHDWTNGLKHKRVPEVDTLAPITRWDTDFDAVSTLLSMFADFANQNGVLEQARYVT